MRNLRLMVLWLCLNVSASGQRVNRAYIGPDNLVHIALENGREVTAPKERRLSSQRLNDEDDFQASVERPVISADRRSVAWLVNFSNCCTSYPIPLTLVVFRDRRVVHRFGGGLPIFRFVFARGGQAIAYYQDILHGESAAHCELRDLKSGRLVGERSIWDKGPLPMWAWPFAKELETADTTEPEP